MKPMKTFIKSGWQILSISILFVPGAARCHDGWVEISPAIVEKIQNATIALIQGNHSNEHKSYRIAGQWDPKYATLVDVDPQRTANSITNRLIDMGEDADGKIDEEIPRSDARARR